MKVICNYCKKIVMEVESEEDYYRKLEGQKHIQCQYCGGFMKVELS